MCLHKAGVYSNITLHRLHIHIHQSDHDSIYVSIHPFITLRFFSATIQFYSPDITFAMDYLSFIDPLFRPLFSLQLRREWEVLLGDRLALFFQEAEWRPWFSLGKNKHQPGERSLRWRTSILQLQKRLLTIFFLSQEMYSSISIFIVLSDSEWYCKSHSCDSKLCNHTSVHYRIPWQ